MMLGRARYGGDLISTGGARRLTWVVLVAVALLALSGVEAAGALAAGGPPTVETEKAREITRTMASLTASVDPQGSLTECSFEYGTSKGVLDESVPCAFSPGSRPIDVPEYAQLEHLTPSTLYYFRVEAKNEHGESFGEEAEFTSLLAKPTPKNLGAVDVGRTSATLAGYVTPNGSPVTECYFEYGTMKNELSESAPCAQEVGEGSEPSEPVYVTANVVGLEESAVYYLRVVARNAVGVEQSGRGNFRTLPSEPLIETEPATLVERTSATLKGFVTPNDALLESCYFEYGEPVIAGPLEKTIPCETLPGGAGTTPEPVSARLTGLPESTQYEFRLIATNSVGIGEGGTRHFMTQPSGPKVLLHQAREITMHSAELTGAVDPEDDLVTECYFEYGATPALGGVAPCSTLPGDGEKYVKVTAMVSGLTPDTAYQVKIIAANAFGEDRRPPGEQRSFTTATGAEPPVVKAVKPAKGISAGGTKATVSGSHFENVIAVYFGEAEAKIEHVTTTEIEVTSPPGVGTVDVTVETEAGTSKISSADHFVYGGPEISGLSPSSGPTSGGTEVTVSGSGFELGTHGTSFSFAKVSATSVECTSSTSCIVIAPPASKGKAKTVAVQATVNGKKSPKRNDSFTYTAG